MATDTDKMILEILEEILGPDANKVSVDFEKLLPHNLPGGTSLTPKALFRPGIEQKNWAGVRELVGFEKPKILLDSSNKLYTTDPSDVRYRIAHEAGHAKDYFGRAKSNPYTYNMASKARKEVLADSAAMKYFRKYGYKFGPAMARGATSPPPHPAYRFFGPMAKRYGLLPMLLMGLLGSMGTGDKDSS